MGTYYDQSSLNKSRSDKFTLFLNLPEALRNYNKQFQRNNSTVDLNTIQFSIYGIVVPKNNIPAEDVRYAGGNIYVSSHNKPSYEPVSVKFTIDNQFNNYWVIHKWLDLLRNEKSGIFEYPEKEYDRGVGQYTTDLSIVARDEFNKEVIQWIYKSAFPISLGEIDYDHRKPDEIETSFEFVFRKIETNLLKV